MPSEHQQRLSLPVIMLAVIIITGIIIIDPSYCQSPGGGGGRQGRTWGGYFQKRKLYRNLIPNWNLSSSVMVWRAPLGGFRDPVTRMRMCTSVMPMSTSIPISLVMVVGNQIIDLVCGLPLTPEQLGKFNRADTYDIILPLCYPVSTDHKVLRNSCSAPARDRVGLIGTWAK